SLKMGIALGGALTGWLLGAVGYEANQTQTELALNGIVFIYAGGSVIAGLMTVGLLFFYRLTRDWSSATAAKPEPV
ncbi:MAG: MFS transporter, partial [Pseudomonadales bacterium]